MYWFDGNVYRGEWKEGVQHGKGELFIKNEGLMCGIFNINKLVLLHERKKLTRDEYFNRLLERDGEGKKENEGKKKYKSNMHSRNSTISNKKEENKIKCYTTERNSIEES
jgi:hypothetical protein